MERRLETSADTETEIRIASRLKLHLRNSAETGMLQDFLG
jgi:hypothetical protein